MEKEYHRLCEAFAKLIEWPVLLRSSNYEAISQLEGNCVLLGYHTHLAKLDDGKYVLIVKENE